MKASAGKSKVLMVAFGHPENVLSLCKAVSREVHIDLVFVVAEERFRQGILDIDISSMDYGLNLYSVSIEFLPEEVKEFIGDSFRVRFIRTPSKSILRNKALQNYTLLCKSARALNKENYDVVHFNGSSWFAGYFSLFLGGSRKNIWTIHDYIPHTGEGDPKSFFLRRLFMMVMDFEYIQHYKWLKERFIKRFNIPSNKVHHIYSGPFDIFKCFKPVKIAEHTDYMLFFGRISPYKGIDLLIDSFILFKQKYPELNIKLYIAGSGKLWFDNQVLDHPDIILINRYISTDELVYLLTCCRFVVLPYTDSTHSAVVMTSYVFRKPVIANDVGGLHEVILHGNTGFLTSSHNTEQMANAMFQLSSDDTMIRSFEHNIEYFVNQGSISWAKVAKKMKEVYCGDKE